MTNEIDVIEIRSLLSLAVNTVYLFIYLFILFFIFLKQTDGTLHCRFHVFLWFRRLQFYLQFA